jgi:hypothetical protein
MQRMEKKSGRCEVPRGFALYCVGTGGQLKKA